MLSSAILILTHVGSAIVIVLTGAAIIQRTLVGAGRAPILERSSQILIVLFGLWLLWRAFRPHHHDHGRSGSALALVGGLVTCPLTTFIMAYAVANGLVLAGLLLGDFRLRHDRAGRRVSAGGDPAPWPPRCHPR